MTTAIQVKERPILFSGPMVRALLAGTKTQTRRAIKDKALDMALQCPTGWVVTEHGRHYAVDYFSDTSNHVEMKCPYGQPGDRLYVRETFYAFGFWDQRPKENEPEELEWFFTDLTLKAGLVYQYEEPSENVGRRRGANARAKWWKRPSIHMPRAASRLLLEITAVRCEHLQSISEADAVAEGIEKTEDWGGDWTWYQDYLSENNQLQARESYASLWRKINGPDSWAANPWVWVVEFKVLTAN